MKRLIAIAGLVLAVCLPAQAALTLQTIGYAGTDADWTARVSARVVQDAFAIISEPVGTANHANRLVLAGNILREPGKWASRFTVATAGAVSTSATTLAGVTDTQLNTAVDSLLDGFANYAQ